VAKVYEVELATPLSGDEAARFAAGTLVLQGERDALLPAQLAVRGDRLARLTIHEGRYHQVRRMFAAVGNHVTALRRVAMGPLALGDLADGHWRVLSDEEKAALVQASTKAAAKPSANAFRHSAVGE
jgi:16S rRNA pseudouridine516 synthase